MKHSLPLSLAQAPLNQKVWVKKITDTELAIKLLEFGLGEHRSCTVLRKAPFKGPIIVQCNRFQVVIRREEAEQVQVSFE